MKYPNVWRRIWFRLWHDEFTYRAWLRQHRSTRVSGFVNMARTYLEVLKSSGMTEIVSSDGTRWKIDDLLAQPLPIPLSQPISIK